MHCILHGKRERVLGLCSGYPLWLHGFALQFRRRLTAISAAYVAYDLRPLSLSLSDPSPRKAPSENIKRRERL